MRRRMRSTSSQRPRPMRSRMRWLRPHRLHRQCWTNWRLLASAGRRSRRWPASTTCMRSKVQQGHAAGQGRPPALSSADGLAGDAARRPATAAGCWKCSASHAGTARRTAPGRRSTTTRRLWRTASRASGAARPGRGTCTLAAKHAQSGNAGGPGPRCRKALRSTGPGSAPCRPCTPTRERCKCRAVQLLPEGPQQGKAFLEAMQTLQLLLPGLLGWLLQWCRRVTLTAGKVPRPCRAC